jgi:hypothetical protein
VSIRFHSASCVIAGTFNIYIFRPDWLSQAGFLTEPQLVKVELQLNQPGIRLRSPQLGATWTVTPEKLVLETNDPSIDCGQTADRILERLPWTPLKALGCNYAFYGQPDDIRGWSEKTRFPPSDVPAEWHSKQRTWHRAVERDGHVFNLQLGELENRIEMRANVHTDLTTKTADFARETARQFFEHRQTVLTLFQTIFEANIEHALQCHD